MESFSWKTPPPEVVLYERVMARVTLLFKEEFEWTLLKPDHPLERSGFLGRHFEAAKVAIEECFEVAIPLQKGDKWDNLTTETLASIIIEMRERFPA